MQNFLKTLFVFVVVAAPVAAGEVSKPSGEEFVTLHQAYLDSFKPLWLKMRAASWEASTTGSDAAFERKKAADKALVELHSDRDTFMRLKSLKESGRISDPVQRRLLEVMYKKFLPGQADPGLRKRIVELESEIEQEFNTYRSPVGDKTLTENDVRRIVATTTRSTEAEQAWKAYMAIGAKVEARLAALVELRNRMARQLGFHNFYEMKLTLQEIDETELFALFDELDALTREPFARLKSRIDTAAAARFKLSASALRPWHYGDLFFQEAPSVYDVDFDALYANADLIDLGKKYFASMGLPCDDILARSDLYEKEGKSPHAFCSDMNREGDIRVLCNLEPNLYWADTLLHELGHGVYSKYVSGDLPFLLRKASHGITTEGIAEMFGAMAKNVDWLVGVSGMDATEATRIGEPARDTLRAGRLLFSRWTQVMVRFEHAMYTDPGQDLGRLWWDLKKRYQLLNPPSTTDRPDYAAKMHVLTTPVYYHNYLMGELFAAQVRHFIASEVLGTGKGGDTSFYRRPEVGKYLREKVFGPGNLYPWNELTKSATGEPLLAKYFAADVVQ